MCPGIVQTHILIQQEAESWYWVSAHGRLSGKLEDGWNYQVCWQTWSWIILVCVNLVILHMKTDEEQKELWAENESSSQMCGCFSAAVPHTTADFTYVTVWVCSELMFYHSLIKTMVGKKFHHLEYLNQITSRTRHTSLINWMVGKC